MLILSLLALVLGPLLYTGFRHRQPLLGLLDGFLFVTIGSLVLFDILPDVIERAGWLSLVAILVGFLGPSWVEHSFSRAARSAHRIAMLLGLMSLGFHALADGAALSDSMVGTASQNLALAIILHRIPVGLTIWWLLLPAFGAVAASGVLAGMGVLTLVGFSFAGELLPASAWGLGLFQALVAGSLLHVVVHRTDREADQLSARENRLKRRLSGIGALTGILSTLVLIQKETPSSFFAIDSEFWNVFLRLAQQSAPALLIGYLLAALIGSALPARSGNWMAQGGRIRQSLRGMMVGLPLPVCSCGVVPLFRVLARQGAPPAAALAFLVATPELSLDALLLSLPLLGGQMTGARLVAAAALALLVGCLAAGTNLRRPVPQATEEPSVSWASRIKAHFGTNLAEVVDHTAPWLLVGLAAAALVEPFLQPQLWAQLPELVEVPLFALLGIPLYVCASGATPLVAVLILNGVSPGAALAFLLTGPATNVTTFGVISNTLDRGTAVRFAIWSIGLAIILGLIANLWVVPESVPEIKQTGEEGSPIAQLALLAISLLFAASLLRLGPRIFLGQLIPKKAAARCREGESDVQSLRG